MRQIIFIMIIAAAGNAPAAVNPAAQSPIGSPTAVPSAGQNSLVPYRPSTYGTSGNLIMTGNVGGGKEFRGVVPYGSTYYSKSFSSPADSFIRRTSGDPLATDRNPGIYNPYYDPRRTVTSIYRGGQTGLVAPKISPQGRADASSPAGLAQMKNTPFSLEQRPLSTSPQDISRILNQQILLNPWEDPLKANKDPLAKQKPKDQEHTVIKPEQLELPPQTIQPNQNLQENEDKSRQEELNRYEQIREQIMEEIKQQELDAAQDKTEPAQEQSPEKTGDAAEMSELKSRYTAFSDLAQAKANEYIVAAQEFLQEGKFYKAADSFAMAAVWTPEDAQAWIGQVSALFAAGEYMSSAYYLGQALSLRPELMGQKIPQAILMQKRDAFENGLVEAATWQERSQSGELAFLLGYMFWQDGKAQRAVDEIDKAASLIPQSEAIQKLAQLVGSSSVQAPATEKQKTGTGSDLSATPVIKEPNQP